MKFIMHCKTIFLPVLGLLALALLIQNTCPGGFAGKSSVAASCSHCPQKALHSPPTKDGERNIASHTTVHLPMYILDIAHPQAVFRLIRATSPQLVIPNTYQNTAPDEILKPPCV